MCQPVPDLCLSYPGRTWDTPGVAFLSTSPIFCMENQPVCLLGLHGGLCTRCCSAAFMVSVSVFTFSFFFTNTYCLVRYNINKWFWAIISGQIGFNNMIDPGRCKAKLDINDKSSFIPRHKCFQTSLHR